MAGVRLRGVGAPEDHQVGAVLDLAQGTGNLADALKRHAGRAVADGGCRIDAAADAIRDGDGDTLGFTRCIRESVDDRVARVRQDLRGALDSVLQRRRFAAHQRNGPILDVMIEKPRLAKYARPFRFRDVIILNRQIDVIANATAKRAGRISDDFQVTRSRR